jgi:spore germination protein GerM
MKRPLTILILATALLATACGSAGPGTAGPLTMPSTTASSTPETTGAEPSTTSTTTEPGETTTSTTAANPTSTTTPTGEQTGSSDVSVYFLDEAGVAVAVTRRVTTERVARAAIQAIIDGPTSSEAASGLASAMPAETLLLGLTVEAGTATLDLSREAASGGGSTAVLGRLAQVVYTLTEFPTIDRVQLLLDGDRVDYFSGEGVLVGEPLTRDDFVSAIPIGSPVDQPSVAVWGPDDLPPAPVGGSDSRLVVLVAADDTLNVRAGAGVDARVIGELEPGAAVVLAGDEQVVGSSRWVTVTTPAGPGWVNDFYLAPSAPDDAFTGANDPARVVADLAEAFATGDGLSEIVSERGLWVAHHATPIRFGHDDLGGILESSTTYRWGSNALEPDSPEITPKTFSEAVAERFVDAHDDADSRVMVGELVEGPNGRPTQFAIPTEFVGFPYVTVYDPGDVAEYGGLDWNSGIVSLTLEDGEAKVIGLTMDEWSP